MNLQSYQTLIAIAEQESFSQAAKRLNMTLSAVSMQMKALERDLGVEIFDRSVRPPSLTPMGRGLAEASRRVIDEQKKLVDLTRRQDTVLQGEYRVGFIATASVRLLPHFLVKSAKQVPHVKFTVTTGLSENLQRRVAERQLDAAIVTRSDVDLSSLNYTNLRTEDLVYALPSDLEGQKIKQCFEQRPFILFTPNSGIGRLVSNHLKKSLPLPIYSARNSSSGPVVLLYLSAFFFPSNFSDGQDCILIQKYAFGPVRRFGWRETCGFWLGCS